MGQIIISGRCGGYPTKEELPDLFGIPDRISPYPKAMMRTVGAKNKGYPTAALLPDLSAVPDRIPPYPTAMLRCIKGVNDGFPCIVSMTNVQRTVSSQLYFADKKITDLYWNGQQISSAYCGNKKVYEAEYTESTQK